MIVLFQTNIHGHRAEYVDHAITWAGSQPDEVIVWIKDCESAEASSRFARHAKKPKIFTGPLNFVYLDELRTSGKSVRLFFLDGDRELLFGVRNWRKLRWLEPTFLLMRLNAPSKFSTRELSAFFVKFAVALAMQNLGRAQVKRLVFLHKSKAHLFGQVRDPLPRRVENLALQVSEPDSIMELGIVGTLDQRKSIELAVASLDKISIPVRLNLVGQVTTNYKEVLQKLVRTNGRVRLVDKHLSEDELMEEVANLDCFLVLQKTNAPSGTILRALDCGIPVVVGGSRVLKLAARKYPSLVTWTKLDQHSLGRAIEKTRQKTKNRVCDLPTPFDFANDLLGGKGV